MCTTDVAETTKPAAILYCRGGGRQRSAACTVSVSCRYVTTARASLIATHGTPKPLLQSSFHSKPVSRIRHIIILYIERRTVHPFRLACNDTRDSVELFIIYYTRVQIVGTLHTHTHTHTQTHLFIFIYIYSSCCIYVPLRRNWLFLISTATVADRSPSRAPSTIPIQYLYTRVCYTLSTGTIWY